MKPTVIQLVLIVDYLLAIGVVVMLTLSQQTSTLTNNLYGVLFLGFIPLLGGIHGLLIARRWGSFKSAVGRAIVFFSLGLISWGLGTYIFSGVYNFLLQVEVPYPSIADFGYILSIPLWVYGMVQLSRAMGATYGLRSSKGKIFLLIIPLIIIGASYYLLVSVARDGVISSSFAEAQKLFFDLAYPIGDIIILTLVTLVYGLSYKFFGGAYKKAVYGILFGFVLMYLADFSFSYTTTTETFFPGNWVDLLFTTAMFALSIGVSLLDPVKLYKENSPHLKEVKV